MTPPKGSITPENFCARPCISSPNEQWKLGGVRSWQGSLHSSHCTLLHTTHCLLTHPWHPHHRGLSRLVKNMHDGGHLMTSMWNKSIQITILEHWQWINILYQSSIRMQLENQSLFRHWLLSTPLQAQRASPAFGHAPLCSSWDCTQLHISASTPSEAHQEQPSQLLASRAAL